MCLCDALPSSLDHFPQHQKLTPAFLCIRTWPCARLLAAWYVPVTSEGPEMWVVGRPGLSLAPLSHAPTDCGPAKGGSCYIAKDWLPREIGQSLRTHRAGPALLYCGLSHLPRPGWTRMKYPPENGLDSKKDCGSTPFPDLLTRWIVTHRKETGCTV